jgi:exodeoxyribonuclease VII large subunit
MRQGTLFNSISISVTDLTRYLRELLDSDDLLRGVWVAGEISNASTPASGHLYFTLKDQNATLKCVMWKPQVLHLRFALRPGMAVEVHGAVSIYEQGGQYQLYADAIRPVGEGAFYQEFLRLKSQLEAEGLFDPARKRPLPEFPHRIGIVTSATGAALQDILNTLQRRYPLVEALIAPAAVQGEAAPGELVMALRRLYAEPGVDLILIARGGGSVEDLLAFNDEIVVRTVADSPVPVISGVGHETDFTLTDFAADLRAPTPTAAAEQSVPDRFDLLDELSQSTQSLSEAMEGILSTQTVALQHNSQRLALLSPAAAIDNNRQRLDELEVRVENAWQYQRQRLRSETNGLELRLNALNPYAVLQRGYALVLDENGHLVRSHRDVVTDDKIHIQIADGIIAAKVENSRSREER